MTFAPTDYLSDSIFPSIVSNVQRNENVYYNPKNPST